MNPIYVLRHGLKTAARPNSHRAHEYGWTFHRVRRSIIPHQPLLRPRLNPYSSSEATRSDSCEAANAEDTRAIRGDRRREPYIALDKATRRGDDEDIAGTDGRDTEVQELCYV